MFCIEVPRSMVVDAVQVARTIDVSDISSGR